MAELICDILTSDGKPGFSFIKARPEPVASGDFKPHELIQIPHGYKMRVDERSIVTDKGGHLKIEFTLTVEVQAGERKGEKITWKSGYIYGSHWKGLSATFAAKQALQTRFSHAGSNIILQPAPLFIQNDNKDWADDGSASNLRYGAVQCGLTSAAMLIASIWPNAKVKQLTSEAGGQFEDWVAGQFKRLGVPSTSMEGHVAVLNALGIKSRATRSATIGDLKQALHKHPVIMGMAYKASGHFVCGAGVADKPGDLPETWPVGKIDNLIPYPQDADQAGVLINDPYGQRDYSGSGNNWINIAREMYDTFGLHNVLTNSILERFWVDGGEESGWAVFVDPSTPNAGNRPEKPVEFQPTQASQSSNVPRKYRPQEFRLNSVAIALIKSFEGLELSAYVCSAGVITIGLGTTVYPNGQPVKMGDTCTEEQAIEYFRHDSDLFIKSLRDLIDVPLTGLQIAALTSWVYNCGEGALAESTLLRVLNQGGGIADVQAQLRRWTNGGLAGLVSRRNAECALWEGDREWQKYR